MVKGLDLFRDFFAGFEDAYILIGGAACDRLFEEKGLSFRATTDLDIILVAEALTKDFTERFWQFITDGEYQITQTNEGQKQYFRFHKPQTKDFPQTLELFSRKPDAIEPKEGMKFTPIPAGEDVSNLSAILMDEEYYGFTLKHSAVIDGLHIASDPALICLKAKAYLDLTKRRAEGARIDKKDILKHRADVIRLSTLIDKNAVLLSPGMKGDLDQFIAQVEDENPETKDILKSVSLPIVPLEEILNILRQVFIAQ